MPSRLVRVTRHEEVFVVRFLDRKLTGDLPRQLGEELSRVADQEQCTRLLLNFSGVDFLASDMLRTVVQLNKKLKQKGGKLTLCEICPCLRQVFIVTKLDTIIPLKDTECEGLAACA
jgi:anti-sigma B factor antagonist